MKKRGTFFPGLLGELGKTNQSRISVLALIGVIFSDRRAKSIISN
jgi:hypothetical protein